MAYRWIRWRPCLASLKAGPEIEVTLYQLRRRLLSAEVEAWRTSEGEHDQSSRGLISCAVLRKSCSWRHFDGQRMKQVPDRKKVKTTAQASTCICCMGTTGGSSRRTRSYGLVRSPRSLGLRNSSAQAYSSKKAFASLCGR